MNEVGLNSVGRLVYLFLCKLTSAFINQVLV